ncbi:enhanced level of genomic instability 1 [Halictus rubicundus]|uniref:enhanced level of genomic instability 1 n=1 Tax=Halictus rubicundus TaxID=77578 RepID=UPI004035115E
MKNITQYLVDSVKSSGATNVDAKQEKEANNGSRGKRNRVKIKISRSNTKERVCDIIESNNDMIDKTPSPFTRENKKVKNSHETPTRSPSKSKLPMLTSLKKLESKSLDYLSLESNGACHDNKYKKRSDKRNSDSPSRNNKKSGKQLKDKKDTGSDMCPCSSVKNKDPDIIDLVNDKEDNNHEESNAFQILMNRKKQGQSLSPTKLPSTDEANIKKSEEYKIKLKKTKEKLVALADKKGYSKRKLLEIEEGEKIEHIIQTRIKSFTKDEKKDTNGETNVVTQTQTQSCSSLLNYFSKVPVNSTHSNTANMSTIVVKADVHMAENSTQHNIYSSSSKCGTQLNRQNKLDTKLSKIDDINIIESENLNITCKNRKHDQYGQNKHRWSLRIKLQNSENKNYVPDESSDDEIFSTQRRTKLNIKSSKKSEVTKSIDSEEISIINDCVNGNSSKLKRKTADKLAPLFTKRRKPDPDVLAARRLFLQPDVTDKSKTVDRKATPVNGTLPFPVISHVTQLSNLQVSCNETNGFHIPEKLCIKYIPAINVSDYKSTMDFSEVKLKPSKNMKAKIPEVLTEIEKICTDTRKIWSVVSLISKGHAKNSNKTVSPRSRTKRNKLLGEGKIIEEKNTEDQFENCSWTYKYRPKTVEEVVGNEEAATKLKEWLIGWKATFRNEDNSSGDEFYSSDSVSSRIHENNQVAVLLGPHGSGKTASVYAVAEEFGYTVLEVNASSRRTGKILLKELEEATKSHRIKKNSSASTFLNLISDEILPKKIPQKSLVLLKDVDLVFEEDEGFISATYQLASNTKRPIVMTCRDICPHLAKMAPQQNRIYFQQASGSRVIALLHLISLAETGYSVPTDYATQLVQIGDLRKAILEVQYLMLSNPTHVSKQSIILKNLFWQNMRRNLYKPAIKASKKQKAKKIADSKTTNFGKHILNDVANKLDNIVLLSSLIDLENSVLNLSEIKMQPCMSLIESTASYSASNRISLDIAEWLSEKVVYDGQLDSCDGTSYQNSITLKRQLNKGINSALSHSTSLLLDRQVLSTDYLPSLRTICRAEESRANMNNKRGNRFFHYLHSLKGPSMSLKPNILSAACRVMCDVADNNANGTITSV